MGCAFIKLCPEWSGYKIATRKPTPPGLESSPLLQDESKKQTDVPNRQLLCQEAQCLLNEALHTDDHNAMAQSTTITDPSLLVEQAETLNVPTEASENLNKSLDSDDTSELSSPSLAALPSPLTSNFPSTSLAEIPPDILYNTVDNGSEEDVNTHEQNIDTHVTGTPTASTAENCLLPDFHVEQVLSEYTALVEECSVLRTRIQTIEAEIDIERTRKSELLESLQKQFAEMASAYNTLQNKSNLMLLSSGLPLLVLMFAVLMVIYPTIGAVASTPT